MATAVGTIKNVIISDIDVVSSRALADVDTVSVTDGEPVSLMYLASQVDCGNSILSLKITGPMSYDYQLCLSGNLTRELNATTSESFTDGADSYKLIPATAQPDAGTYTAKLSVGGEVTKPLLLALCIGGTVLKFIVQGKGHLLQELTFVVS